MNSEWEGGQKLPKKKKSVKIKRTTAPNNLSWQATRAKCLAGQIGWRLLKNAELPNGDYYRNQSASLHHATTNAIFGAFE
jgi:hypothetical protein